MNRTNNQTLQKLKNAFAQDLKEYCSIPFWSWNNTLDPKELVRQIEDMKSAGIGGFIMHARTGLVKEQGISEELKAKDPLLWVQRMNQAKASAEEFVLREVVYR